MLATILNKQNADLIVEEVEIFPLEVGQVLVKVEASSVCGRQIAEITGAKGRDWNLPHLLGHEGCGIVEDIGAGVKSVSIGDKVVMHWRKGNGIESDPPRYKWGNDVIGGGLVTTLSEKAVVSENRLTKVDQGMPSVPAALLGCASTTALGLINNEAKLKIGEGIMVLGAGGVGLSVIQAAKLVSAHPIIAIDINEAKLKKAEELGATHCCMNEPDLYWGEPAEVVVETTGIPAVIQQAYQAVTSGGKIILVGQPDVELPLTISRFAAHYRGITVQDSEGGLTEPHIDIPRYVSLYKKGILKLDSLITDKYHLSDINKAIADMRRGQVVGKCAITFN